MVRAAGVVSGSEIVLVQKRPRYYFFTDSLSFKFTYSFDLLYATFALNYSKPYSRGVQCIERSAGGEHLELRMTK
jgi:hypothetical protein